MHMFTKWIAAPLLAAGLMFAGDAPTADASRRPRARPRTDGEGRARPRPPRSGLARIVHEGGARSRRERGTARDAGRDVVGSSDALCPDGSGCVRSRSGDANAPWIQLWSGSGAGDHVRWAVRRAALVNDAG